MSFKQTIKDLTPAFIKTKFHDLNHAKALKKFESLPTTACNTQNLQLLSAVSLPEIVNSDVIAGSWEEAKTEMGAFTIPDGTGGVNPGDRRALYYLIRHFKPLSVLEIGTHIGASTIHIATALSKNKIETGQQATITTADIRDVNCTAKKPWLEFGTKHSPKEMVTQLGFGDFVNFVTGTSVQFLESCDKTFDFIFLDGNHSAATVYQEIPLALKLLNPNGVILLHDYFPKGMALWSDGTIIDGPYRATERFKKEGAPLSVLPLGNLPWPTKFNSNSTSLALLLKG